MTLVKVKWLGQDRGPISSLVEWRVGGHCTGGVVGGRALHWWSGGWEGIALVEWWVGGHCTGGVEGERALYWWSGG